MVQKSKKPPPAQSAAPVAPKRRGRPSLYGAFGDKRELYIKSYQRYRADARAAMLDIFRDELPIRKRLERIYAVALDIYLSGDAGPRGCFTVMTAASEA